MSKKLTKENYEQETSEGLVLVDFWAPWCGPCRMISPIIESLSEEFEGRVKICKINVDEEQDLAVKNGVRSIPHIMIMKNGNVEESFVGAQSEVFLKDKIISYLS